MEANQRKTAGNYRRIEQLIKKRIAEFEAEHGIIDEATLASN